MPGRAEFAAAAHLGDGPDPAAVQQAEAVGAEDGFGVQAVGAVTVEHGGVRWLAQFRPVNQGHRDLDAIRGLHQDALRHIGISVEAMHHHRLADGALMGVQVIVHHRRRRHHRRVLEAKSVGVVFGIAMRKDVIDGVRKLHDVVETDAHAPQAAFALYQHQMLSKSHYRFEQDGRAMRDDFAPVFGRRIGHGHFQQPVVAALVVDAHVETVALMGDVVFDLRAAGVHQLRRAERRIGRKSPDLRGGRARQRQQHPGAAASLGEAQVEAFIGLMEDAGGCGLAQLMTPEFKRALGLVNFVEEQGLVVVGPFEVVVSVDQAVGQ